MLDSEKHKKLRQEFDKYLDEILNTAQTLYDVKDLGKTYLNQNCLKKFYLYSSQQNPYVINSWLITRGQSSFALCCIEIDSTLIIKGRYTTFIETQTHKFLFGYLKTKQDFGESLIRPETFKDKIVELFERSEIDFQQHREFSRKYYCLSRDYFKFKEAMTNPLMDYLASLSHLELEFSGYECLFKPERSIINRKESLLLIEIGLALAKIIS